MTLASSVRSPQVKSAAMQQTVNMLERVLESEAGVLIYGEAGTGRGSLARAIHQAVAEGRSDVAFLLKNRPSGSGSDRPFVAFDCSVAHDHERLLFGRAREVMKLVPVASEGRRAELVGPWAKSEDDLDEIATGCPLHQAGGGTLFLRHIDDLPIRVQVRLARVLRDGEVQLAGEDGRRPIPMHVRVIASADPVPNLDADDRLAVDLRRRLPERVYLPPLRERRDDVPMLVRELLIELCMSMHLPSKVASKQAIALLAALPWHDNIRELRNVLGALILKCPGRLVRLDDVLTTVRLDSAPLAVTEGNGTLKTARERFEREYVAAVLRQHHGRMADAAKTLGIQRTNLYRKMRQLAVERQRGKP
jgi:DNA-binding NtrC family response regulator